MKWETIVTILAASGCAFLTCCLIYSFRKDYHYPGFRSWWDAEGLACFMMIVILYFLIAEARSYPKTSLMSKRAQAM